MPNCSIRYPLAAAGGLAVALIVAGCASSSGAAKVPAPSSSSGSTSPAAAARRDRGPAASGTIAAITGHTMQVQNQQSGQVAVTWTSATTFSHEVQVSASRIVTGACVVASAVNGSSGSNTSFTAERVVLSAASGGSCNGGFSGGNRPAGAPDRSRPAGPPSGFPSGAPRGSGPGGARTGAFAAGTVSARTGDVVTVTMPAFGSSSAPAERTVRLAATTKVYEQATTTATSLAVGRCVTVQGKADSSGAVSATRVQISPPTAGSCTASFGRVGSGG